MSADNSRFVKLAAKGKPLKADAKSWPIVGEPGRGLMWTVGEKKVPNWEAAKSAVTAMNKAKVGGFTDWRLPSVEELFLLADRTKYNPAIDKDFFPDCESNWYWSSTPAANSPGDYAWFVIFSSGSAGWSNQGYGGFVRAVRASQ